MEELSNKITRRSARKNAARKKAHYLKNKQIRADLYARHKGNNGWMSDVNTWHTTLRALSLGTAG